MVERLMSSIRLEEKETFFVLWQELSCAQVRVQMGGLSLSKRVTARFALCLSLSVLALYSLVVV